MVSKERLPMNTTQKVQLSAFSAIVVATGDALRRIDEAERNYDNASLGSAELPDREAVIALQRDLTLLARDVTTLAARFHTNIRTAKRTTNG
jgi:hypothetical protein